MALTSKFDARLRVARNLWASMLASVGVYAGLLASGAVVTSPDAQPVPLAILLSAAAASAVASVLVPPFLHRRTIARTTFAIDELPLTSAPTGYRDTSGHFRQLAPAVYDVALALYFVPFIVGLALAESVAIFGFVGVVTGHPLAIGLGFFAVSGVLVAMRFPTRQAAIAPIEKHTAALAPPIPETER